ncbi:hypothetical protein [Mariniflexile maritimum]|jgi:hypothetical protein|uniref:hypothetical protein n=1 Tax=Mariniflexile maritimum TaxID=2682493 RepID=UPI0012F6F394|nr:hypothetical protein [Mariniflexile maritimum]MCB0449111.1 hypothetical protein [Confluentibacter sp.]HMQ43586.1 hypothetical protein [Mariniflexile sp.]HMR15681.1 hypothetical protein [Mariniflexile sp.]
MNKYTKLFLGILFDALGYVSFIIPGIGEFSDIVWAPLSGWLMTRLYKGKMGKIAGVFTFIEEALPGFDFIPSFTLMWIYTYVFSKEERVVNIKK